MEELMKKIKEFNEEVEIICNSLLAFNKEELRINIKDFDLYNENCIKDTIMNFGKNNMYEIDEDYLFLELEKLLEGGIGQYE